MKLYRLVLLSLWPLSDAFQVTHSPPLRLPATSLLSVDRRQVLGGALGGAWLGNQQAASASSSTATQPLADLPMTRLRIPQAGVGREYVAVQLKIGNKGPFYFMVDSGLTTELLTPHLQSILGIADGKDKIQGLAAGGSTMESAIVELKDASLYCGPKADRCLDLPMLHAVITDFPQEHIDPAHDPVEGMLGMEFLEQFDVEFDFAKNRLRLWKPGTADKRGLVEIPAVVINETGLIGIRLTVPGGKQPILAFIDCGSTFSACNWQGAQLLGFPPQSDPRYRQGLAIAAMGVDGRLLQLPMVETPVTFVGDVETDPQTGRPVGFAAPPKEWNAWTSIPMAVGDLPAFSTVLGDGRSPFQGPAALLGLDVLAQRRVILEAGTDKTRRRRLWVAPK